MATTILITGASSGIGAAFARAYAKRKYRLILVARRKEKLQHLATELEENFGASAEVLAYDLSDPNTPQHIKSELASRGISVDVLVNNAGYGVPGTFCANAWHSHAAANQLMVTSVAELSHIFLSDMMHRKSGTIINIASIAGLIPSTGGHTLYGAMKSWMIQFSEALAAEVAALNIRVIAVCPGFTFSEFHDVTGTRESVSKLPKYFWLSSEEVVEKCLIELDKHKRRSTPIFVPGRFNKFLVMLNRVLPKFLVIKLLDRYNHIARNSDDP